MIPESALWIWDPEMRKKRSAEFALLGVLAAAVVAKEWIAEEDIMRECDPALFPACAAEAV